jgi:hypothetical protein
MRKIGGSPVGAIRNPDELWWCDSGGPVIPGEARRDRWRHEARSLFFPAKRVVTRIRPSQSRKTKAAALVQGKIARGQSAGPDIVERNWFVPVLDNRVGAALNDLTQHVTDASPFRSRQADHVMARASRLKISDRFRSWKGCEDESLVVSAGGDCVIALG